METLHNSQRRRAIELCDRFSPRDVAAILGLPHAAVRDEIAGYRTREYQRKRRERLLLAESDDPAWQRLVICNFGEA